MTDTIIHIVWAQGWSHAPPMALRNAEMWEGVGEVKRWGEASAVLDELVTQKEMDSIAHPAMKADMILAAAQLKYGGMAVGADMSPQRPDKIIEACHLSGEMNRGLVVWGSYRHQPFNGGSFFPAGNEFLWLVNREHRRRVITDLGQSERVKKITGPVLWDELIRSFPSTWCARVTTVPGHVAFSYEPESQFDSPNEEAWINPGLNHDWLGDKPELWK